MRDAYTGSRVDGYKLNIILPFPLFGAGITNLPCGVATVHAQVAASHETAGITEQENSGTTVLLGTRQTAEHVLLGPLVAALREINEQLLNHSRDDVARRDSVDTNVVRAPLSCQVPAKLDDGSLASIVGGTNETLCHVSPRKQK